MRTLAIDCATEACSVALFEGEQALASDFRVLGRGHAEHLVPMIAALPGRGKAQRILVSVGPGSFTGVRIGIATARALAVAWRADVAGYPTLALVAAMAIRQADADGVTVCMKGGHGEWFVQDFGRNGSAETDLASLSPEEAATRGARPTVAGSESRSLAAALGAGYRAIELLPDAARAIELDPSLFTASIAPIYGRGPDARLPA